MVKKVNAKSSGIVLKKRHGQHFLRDTSVIDHMLSRVDLDAQSNVFEIGCGDGFLTQHILHHQIARLWVFEVDKEWASYVEKKYGGNPLQMFHEDILQVDFDRLQPYAPWTLLSNLPYNITFPILHKLQEHRELLKEGVIMVQEEVAQKIVKTTGRGFGYASLFFQYYFDWELLRKVPKQCFYPQPSVSSRLLYFRPRKNVLAIPDEKGFWQFIRHCFKQPRRTIGNNLKQTDYIGEKLPESLLAKRGQELTHHDFIWMWDTLR